MLRTENKKVWVRSFTTGRLLHHALCHYLELEEQETPAFQIGYGENGKPFCWIIKRCIIICPIQATGSYVLFLISP